MLRKILFGALFCTIGSAQAEILTFEEFAAGTRIDNEYSSNGVTIKGVNNSLINNNNNLTLADVNNLGVVFDTTMPTGGDSDLASPFTNAAGEVINPGNVLILHENLGTCNDEFTCDIPDDEGSQPAGYFDFSFDQAVTINSIDFFDVEGIEAAPGYEIQLFTSAMPDMSYAINPQSLYVPDTGGDNKWERLDVNVSNVRFMRINFGGSGAIDNINFSVSEAPSIALMLGALLVFARRFSARKN